MVPRNYRRGLTRREFLYLSGAALLAACGPNGTGVTSTTGGGPTTTGATGGDAPEETFVEPTQAVSGSLNILLWSHFVPAHDTWFDPFVEAWGEQVGVDVNIDHIAVADVPAAIASEIQSGNPEHDLFQYIAVQSQHEPSVVDMADLVAEAEGRYGSMLDLTRRSSLNPNTGKYYAYAPAWVPDPGDYRL